MSCGPRLPILWMMSWEKSSSKRSRGLSNYYFKVRETKQRKKKKQPKHTQSPPRTASEPNLSHIPTNTCTIIHISCDCEIYQYHIHKNPHKHPSRTIYLHNPFIYLFKPLFLGDNDADGDGHTRKTSQRSLYLFYSMTCLGPTYFIHPSHLTAHVPADMLFFNDRS